MFAFFVVYLISPRRRAPAAAGAMYSYTLAAGVRKGVRDVQNKDRCWTSTVRAKKYSEIKLDLSWIQSQGQLLRRQGVRGPFPWN